jgi:transcriptional regulator with XRE-family HTH domain
MAKKKTKRNADLFDLAFVIRQIRIEMGYSSAERFANEHGLNRSVYQRWESGEDIKLSNLLRLCTIFNLTPIELFIMWEDCNKRAPKTKLHNLLDDMKEEMRKNGELYFEKDLVRNIIKKYGIKQEDETEK